MVPTERFSNCKLIRVSMCLWEAVSRTCPMEMVKNLFSLDLWPNGTAYVTSGSLCWMRTHLTQTMTFIAMRIEPTGGTVTKTKSTPSPLIAGECPRICSSVNAMCTLEARLCSCLPMGAMPPTLHVGMHRLSNGKIWAVQNCLASMMSTSLYAHCGASMPTLTLCRKHFGWLEILMVTSKNACFASQINHGMIFTTLMDQFTRSRTSSIFWEEIFSLWEEISTLPQQTMEVWSARTCAYSICSTSLLDGCHPL
mmetsp:Transcript_8798/g.32543  ORF Transcript_8798/g.32543 Transcript_8798/m.32543 type:complete len:253 (-) Transcript_8798:510-1268(-)